MLKARPVVGPDGEVVRVIGSLADVTEIKSAEERMLHDAIHDNLTGLPNRELFYDRLTSAMHLAQRPGTTAPTVLVIDIDQFKTVNDFLRSFDRRFGVAGRRTAPVARLEAWRHPVAPCRGISSAPSSSLRRAPPI